MVFLSPVSRKIGSSFAILISALTVTAGCTRPTQGTALSIAGLHLTADDVPNSISQTQKSYQQVGAWLKSTMLDCPGRIWPNYNWQTKNVLLLEKGQPSLVWRGSTGAIEALSEDQVPDGARQGLYSFFDWQNEKAVAIYDDGSMPELFKAPLEVFRLIIHEGFHNFGQKDWVSGTGSRGTEYPVRATPRLYRRMLYERLTDFYKSNGTDTLSIGKAAYWLQKWTSEFPVEAQNTTDGYEGTARYVENLGASIATLSCSASDAELQSTLQTFIDSDRYMIDGSEFESDTEGYPLGSLAAFSLHFISHDTTWFEKMKHATTPVRLLLDGVSPIADAIPSDLEETYSKTQDDKNQKISLWIDEEISHQRSKEYIRVVFPYDSMSGSTSYAGFFLPVEIPNTSYAPLALPYTFTGSNWTVTAGASTVTLNLKNPCQKGGSVVLVNQKDAVVADGEIVLKDAFVQGKMPGQTQVDADGYTWFCGTL